MIMKLYTTAVLLGLAGPALSDVTCGIAHGYDRGTKAYFYSGDGSLSTFDLCSAKCLSDSKCQSFAFGDSECLLYSTPLDTNFRQQSDSPFLFYDRDCANAQSTSTFATVMPTTTSATQEASTTAEASVTSEGSTPTPASATLAAQTSQGSVTSPGDGSSSQSNPSATAGAASGSADGTTGGQTATGTDASAASATMTAGTGTGASSGSASGGSSSSSNTGTGSSGTSASTATASVQSSASAALLEGGWWLGASILCSSLLTWV